MLTIILQCTKNTQQSSNLSNLIEENFKSENLCIFKCYGLQVNQIPWKNAAKKFEKHDMIFNKNASKSYKKAA